MRAFQTWRYYIFNVRTRRLGFRRLGGHKGGGNCGSAAVYRTERKEGAAEKPQPYETERRKGADGNAEGYGTKGKEEGRRELRQCRSLKDRGKGRRE